jgi:hypothetical protein
LNKKVTIHIFSEKQLFEVIKHKHIVYRPNHRTNGSIILYFGL